MPRSRHLALALPLCLLAVPALAGPPRSPIHGHIEFLWQRPEPGSGARSVALGLLTRPESPHQACWKSADFPSTPVEVRLEIDDALGRHVLWQGIETASPPTRVRCGEVDLAALGVAPGMRRVSLRFDGRLAAEDTIEVAEDLDSAAFHRTERPFVNGRTDYPRDLPQDDYRGHFVWVLTFGPDGRVIAVDTEEAEGLAADRLQAAGENAARLYRIAAEPDRPTRRFRLRYNILPAGPAPSPSPSPSP